MIQRRRCHRNACRSTRPWDIASLPPEWQRLRLNRRSSGERCADLLAKGNINPRPRANCEERTACARQPRVTPCRECPLRIRSHRAVSGRREPTAVLRARPAAQPQLTEHSARPDQSARKLSHASRRESRVRSQDERLRDCLVRQEARTPAVPPRRHDPRCHA